MSNPPSCKSKLVQRLITSYFPLHDRCPSFANLNTDFDSLLTRTDGYVSETPDSKQGNIAFYLGLCNTVSNSPSRVLRSSRALFERAVVEEAEILHHSPTPSSESVNQRAWRLVFIFLTSFITSFHLMCDLIEELSEVGEVLNSSTMYFTVRTILMPTCEYWRAVRLCSIAI